ncbi:b4777965-7ba1-442f-91ee-4f38e30ed1a0 [Sclerotinia trifoliorum]|uniref:B4777965-7ba1-442f-91ee-4f38e30ed1a0 n=1 Tax=Sclerotinia trifoliorum TaxID=28548 RepID=A0A8H2VZA2_9HELO|nr:b4777965-7ba1-442f-91ee-4f38e30ed1a0 [Sclerotinia trifoliorum]
MEYSFVMGRRPSRVSRLPERYRDGIGVTNPCTSTPTTSTILLPIELDQSACTNSSVARSHHHSTPSPITSACSSPNDTPTSPTSSTRRGGKTWRKEVGATLKQVEQAVKNRPPVEGANSPHMQAARTPRRPARQPVYTAEDEYDITSSGYGLNHTPEWDHTDIDIIDESHPRWFPGCGVSAPTYEDLTNACKLIMVHELTKQMSFKSMISWLQLSDTQLIDFIKIYEIQYQRNVEEERLTLTAMSHLSAIRKVREVRTQDWDRILKEEVDSRLGTSLIDSPIPLEDIDQTIRFIRFFPVQEQLPRGLEIDNVEGLTFIPPEDYPPSQVIKEVVEAMSRYTKLGAEYEWDLDHDIGLRQYIEHETELVGGVDGIMLSDDEGGEEVEDPARRTIGRPKKKKGRQFANKPVRNRSDLSKLKLPSKLQQMESAEDDDEVEP